MAKTSRIILGLPRSGQFKLGLAVAALQSLFAVALLATSAWLISRAAEHPPIMYLSIAVVGVRGFAVGRAAGRYAERILLHDSAFKMLKLQRPRILEKLIPFAPAGMPDRGATISKLVNDVDELQNLPIRVIAPLVQSIVVSLLAVIGVSLLLPNAAMVLALTLLAAFLLALPLSGWASRSADSASAETKSKLASLSVEALENLEILQTYDWLTAKFDEIKTTDAIMAKQANLSAVSAGLGQSLLSVLSAISIFGMAYLGAESVSAGRSPGVLLALFALLPIAVFEVVTIAQPVVSAFNRYRAAASRLGGLLDNPVPRELEICEGELQLSRIESIELVRVSVNYPGRAEILKDFDLTLRSGETLVLHGKSGAGKSTIANILVRFLNPASGSYLINGIPADSFTSESLREKIGLIEQNPIIFNGSVRENLLIAKSSADEAELVSVLTRVGLWSMFSGREGLETQLGERGVLISGGEAQRLALARALLADFELLIMDEPTANVDKTMADGLVRDLLAAAGMGKTVLLITHDADLGSLAQLSLKI